MHEQKNKDIKNADAKNMKAIKSMLTAQKVDTTMMQILNYIMMFLKQDGNASFASVGDEYFKDEKTYGEAVRKCKPEALPKEKIKEIAHKINQDAEGNIGEIQTTIIQS